MTALGWRERAVQCVVAVFCTCWYVIASSDASSQVNSQDNVEATASAEPLLDSALGWFFPKKVFFWNNEPGVDRRKEERSAKGNEHGREGEESSETETASSISPLSEKRRGKNVARPIPFQTFSTQAEDLRWAHSQEVDTPHLRGWSVSDRRSQDLSSSNGMRLSTEGAEDDDYLSSTLRRVRRQAILHQAISRAGLYGGVALAGTAALFGLSRHFRKVALQWEGRDNVKARGLGIMSAAMGLSSLGTLLGGGWMWVKKIKKAHAIAAKQAEEEADDN
ncbi:putative transmembrane protein [Toxoplasma gondii TgCatPRC2]|uniref:Putative transmembrane protein n=1 Tax=Toxoplasma gondii TgCatPRC2 TaxID=1130821 RepID=A0A151HG27_TOXGO|nr:putative transmembrane protein [Toxoplasma gondii TgCatPRC2]